jgi:hypothetical protein
VKTNVKIKATDLVIYLRVEGINCRVKRETHSTLAAMVHDHPAYFCHDSTFHPRRPSW